jgi:hypothetical protein
MNPYRKIIGDLGLTAESQGEHSWLYLLLNIAADKYDLQEPTPPLANPVAEALRWLSDYHPSYAFSRVASILNTLRDKYDR